MAANYEHPVVDEHEEKLKTILQLDPGPELPRDVRDAYFKFKRPLDRIGGHLTDEGLVLIAMIATGGLPEDTKYSFLNVLGDIRKGIIAWPESGESHVQAKWRNKWVDGKFQRVSSGNIVVILDDGTSEEREIAPDKVRLPE